MTLAHVYSGKVRELYEVDADHLLMVASDRVSVFDVVLPDPIPDKGRVLTGISSFWFDATTDIVPNHVVSADPSEFPRGAPEDVAGRGMLVRRTTPVKLECIVRGYLYGHAWAEYRERGTVNGGVLPAGLEEASRLASPIFTPTTKADLGGHDEPLTPDEARALIGSGLHDRVARISIALYELGEAHARSRGIILADTKFEFGVTASGELLLIDEVLTPDSSRYWPADAWAPGTRPPSFDKQYVRDAVRDSGWAIGDPAPRLSAEVIAGTRTRYVQAYEWITGRPFSDWYGPGG